MFNIQKWHAEHEDIDVLAEIVELADIDVKISI